MDSFKQDELIFLPWDKDCGRISYNDCQVCASTERNKPGFESAKVWVYCKVNIGTPTIVTVWPCKVHLKSYLKSGWSEVG